MSKNYSKLSAVLKGAELIITSHRTRHSGKDTKIINLDDIEPGATLISGMKSKSFYYKNKILLVENIGGTADTIVAYTDNGSINLYRHSDSSTHPLSRFIVSRSKVFLVWLSGSTLRLAYVSCVLNKYKLPIKKVYFVIGDDVKRHRNIPIFNGRVNYKTLIQKGIFTERIAIDPLLVGEPQINSSIGFAIELDDDGRTANHFLTRGTKKYTDRTKWYYAPITQARRKGFSISIRRNGHGGLSIVRRRLEEIEKSFKFRLYESVPISFILYHSAHLARKLSSTKVNLYFEKMASQAEEGAVDIFRHARDHSDHSKNYFIIRDTAKAYSTLRREKGVVTNFTLPSYWLMYRANSIIATEVPQHMNILRSGNRYARRAPYSQTFVFLQHGVTYLKPQDKTTSFKRGREGEPDYMVVNSKKERDITADMLNIEEERFINVGMPIFDTTKYNHISQNSNDIVTVMLTWKPYEEHLQDFESSSYYKTTVAVYNALRKLIPEESIRVIAHPKFKQHMLNTDIERVLWQETISNALAETKLLITDYSSVCYNVFYQGGGVVFYQPDIQTYQQHTGTLIPADDEYIGYRSFTEREIKALLKTHIKNEKIDLSSLRLPEYIENYQSINEYHDGKNCQRIYEWLQQKDLV